MTGSKPYRLEVTFPAEQENEIRQMAKECGFRNVAEYARVSMKFFYTMKDVMRSVVDFDSKLDVVLENTKSINSSFEDHRKIVVETAEKVNRLYQQEELESILKEIIRILQANYPKGYNVHELVELIGADTDNKKNDLFWYVLNENKFFKCYVSVDNEFVSLRERPLWSGYELDTFGVSHEGK
ncbi:hypothetical protein [Methanococcus maripaludis]|uniref:Uncharacterized protein n=1 Tax=Methanococcus maripaludis OS7 TaxID=637915 RepID=A0A2Z5PUI4_METMI|nr:hypothetical protein [Methanococcus maripaludis]BAP62111.1 hypothetical protein MMOS7_00250 [Methanococcus maripaludis OS7]